MFLCPRIKVCEAVWIRRIHSLFFTLHLRVVLVMCNIIKSSSKSPWRGCSGNQSQMIWLQFAMFDVADVSLCKIEATSSCGSTSERVAGDLSKHAPCLLIASATRRGIVDNAPAQLKRSAPHTFNYLAKFITHNNAKSGRSLYRVTIILPTRCSLSHVIQNCLTNLTWNKSRVLRNNHP